MNRNVAVALAFVSAAAAVVVAPGCATEQQRSDTLTHTVSIARTVCTICNGACRMVPGAPQNTAASSAPASSGGAAP